MQVGRSVAVGLSVTDYFDIVTGDGTEEQRGFVLLVLVLVLVLVLFLVILLLRGRQDDER